MRSPRFYFSAKGGPTVEVIETGVHPIKAWVDGVEFDAGARRQVENMARLPFIHEHVAVMPDVHVGKGATVGSVIPTIGAIVPAAVGVDIGCGMIAQKLTLRAEDLPTDLRGLRAAIEKVVPVGKSSHHDAAPAADRAWDEMLGERYAAVVERAPQVSTRNVREQLGTMGGGNHFCELCLDESGAVWLVLHSGSRGAGNRIGQYYIERAQSELMRLGVKLVDKDLAHLTEHTPLFDAYVEAVGWAQDYARINRELMMTHALEALRGRGVKLPRFARAETVVNCHHNYVARERHFGADVYVTRKGAVRAGKDELGFIPGSMGARSFVVRGLGNPDSFESCSHGAGRRMSRGEAKSRLTLKDLERETKGIECRKDAGVLDEAPSAYKDIDAVMRAQHDLVRIVHTLRQVVCIKG
ncbi:MAG: RtcB family protein [Candidatus Eremiobacteraeota bacterium]|nr:RtcB family protein [Candidatus Eremiobacteraeota bacterium]